MAVVDSRERDGLISAAVALDVLLELAAAALLLLRGQIANWFRVSPTAVTIPGVVFLLAAAGVGALLRRGAGPAEVRLLGAGNTAGGMLGWLIFALAFRRLTRNGRWLLGPLADAFVGLGLAQLVAAHHRGLQQREPG